MIPNEHLPFFITEEIFVLDETMSTPSAPAKVEEPMEPMPPEVPEQAPSLQSEMIVVCDRFSDADKALLGKILAAVKVDINDVAIVEGEPSQSLDCSRLLVFGDLQVPQTGSELYAAQPEAKWLRASSLNELAGSQEEKMKLWSALKSWFGLS